MTTIAIVAPAHLATDWRVLRTAHAAATIAPTVLYFERRFLEGTDLGAIVPSGVIVREMPDLPTTPVVANLALGAYVNRVATTVAAAAPAIVHVHASGAIGLAICRATRRRLAGARIIFDYHDWIPLEVAYRCRQQRWLYQLYLPLALSRARRWAGSVDHLVATSPAHAAAAAVQLGVENVTAIENVAPDLDLPPLEGSRCERLLVFVGTVMSVRKIEMLVDALASLGEEARAVICGVTKEPGYLRSVLALAERRGVAHRLRYAGGYRGLREVRCHLVRGAIGTLFHYKGLRLDTGFARLCSANKVYSYVRLGLPVGVEADFEHMAEVLESEGAGFRFRDADDLARAAQAIWESPGRWGELARNARRLSERTRDARYRARLEQLYRGLLRV